MDVGRKWINNKKFINILIYISNKLPCLCTNLHKNLFFNKKLKITNIRPSFHGFSSSIVSVERAFENERIQKCRRRL